MTTKRYRMKKYKMTMKKRQMATKKQPREAK